MRKSSKLKKVLLWLAAVRIAIGIAAIPLAKFLYEDNFLILVLMRPTKEVMLAGAFLAKHSNKPSLIPQIVLAAVPLSILGVWQSYYLGRMYAGEIKRGDVSGIGGRILPVKKIKQLSKVLKKKGPRLVILGRLAAFPSALLAASAGSSDMPSKKFLPPDAIGGMLSIAEVVGAGYFLASIFNPDDKTASWIITGAGVAVLFVFMFLLGWYLRRE